MTVAALVRAPRFEAPLLLTICVPVLSTKALPALGLMRSHSMTTSLREVVSRLRFWLGWDDATPSFFGLHRLRPAPAVAPAPPAGVGSRRRGSQDGVSGASRICPR